MKSFATIVVLVACCVWISWAKPQEPIDPPKVCKPIPRHDELRNKPEEHTHAPQIALGDKTDEDIIALRVRRAAQQPVVLPPSGVSTDDPIVQEAAQFVLAENNYNMRPPLKVLSAARQVTGMYTIKFQATLPGGRPEDIATCTAKVLHLPEGLGHKTKFQMTNIKCVA